MVCKRVLHITSSLRRGGAEEVLCSLIEHMGTERFEHVVLYMHSGPHEQRLRARGIPLCQIRGLFWRYDPVFFFRLWRAVGRYKPDVIHALLWVAALCGRIIACLKGIPCVCVIHNNADQNGMVRNLLDRLVGVARSQVVAVSAEVAQSLQWIPAARVPVITNGIDVDVVHEKARQAAISRQKLGLTNDHFVFGSVGRFEPVKRYDLLLASFAYVHRKFPAARLILVGQGSQESILRSMARELGILSAIIFVVGQAAYGYYALFDCFVLTSFKEGVSIALLEAMSFKLPCVITNSSRDHTVLQTGYSGLVVPTNNAEEFSQAMVCVMSDPEARIRWGNAAYSYVKTHGSSARMVADYEQLFEVAQRTGKSR